MDVNQRLERELAKAPMAAQWLFDQSGHQLGQRRCILHHSVSAKYIIPLDGSLLLPALQFAKL